MKTGFCKLGIVAAVYALSMGCGAIRRDLTGGITTSNDLQNSSSHLEQSVVAILSTNCVSCHGASGVGGLSNITDTSALISAGLVVPGNPAGSALYTQVASAAMPLNAAALASTDVQTIQSWINALGTPIPQGGATPSPSGSAVPAVSFSTSIFPVMQTDCVLCHGGGNGRTAFTSYANVLTVVQAGSPANSTLYQKISPGGSMAGYSPAPLTQNIYYWILQGAPNN